MICYLDTTFCISPNCKNDCGIGLAEQYEVANAYLAEHPADEDEPITDAWLRELSDTPSSHAFAVCFRGVHGVALSVMRYRDGFSIYADSTLIQYVKTRGQLRKLLEALGINGK